jgi:hypothetical protein
MNFHEDLWVWQEQDDFEFEKHSWMRNRFLKYTLTYIQSRKLAFRKEEWCYDQIVIDIWTENYV